MLTSTVLIPSLRPKDAGDIAWWENTNGEGSTWSTPNVLTATLSGAIDAIPADLDGDGDLDVLGASETNGDVFWWENVNGDGSTWNAVFIDSSFDAISAIAVADVDGDGDLDGVGVGTGQVRWFDNLAGDGSSWSSHLIAVALPDPNAVAVADLDRNGDVDIAVGFQSSNAIAWWRYDGVSWVGTPISSAYTGADDIHIADVDGDGDPDVLGAFPSDGLADGIISWLENDGDGGGWADHRIIEDFNGVVSVTAADLDGDGDLDVAGASNTTDETRWWENTSGDGSTWDNEYPIDSPFDGARAIGAADINGDGIMDILGAAETADDVVWLQNRTVHRNAYYPLVGAVTVDGSLDAPVSITVGDFDRNGVMDILAGGEISSEVAWFQNNAGDGSSWTKKLIDNGLASLKSVAVGDLDSDGDLDVLAADNFADAVFWWANDGNGAFGTSQEIIGFNLDDIRWVTTGDMDGDGDLDVVGAGRQVVSWCENTDGSGTTFGAPVTIASLPSLDDARSVSVADFDRDGDLDVLTVAYATDTISWWENESGDGSSWGQHDVDDMIDLPLAAIAADLDGDGDLDVIGTSETDDDFSWWENTNGAGTFGPRQTIATGLDQASSVFGADLDRDGDTDLVGTAYNGDTLAWFENENGGASWTTHIIASDVQGAAAAYVTDVNGDGSPDILSAALTADTTQWWENRGGQFSLTTVDTSPITLPEGQATDVMAITFKHLGRPGDETIELAGFEFLFEESPGNTVDSFELNAVVENFHIYLDEGSGLFEDNLDTLIITVDELNPISGYETIQLPSGEPGIQLTPGQAKTYFIVFEITEDAGTQIPNQILLTHLTDDAPFISSAVEAAHEIPLQIAYTPNEDAFLFTFSPDLFIEKFANELPGPGAAPTFGGLGLAPEPIQPGGLITYTVFFSNTGTIDATGVVISDRMPPEAFYDSSFSSGVPMTLTVNGDTYLWDLATLPPDTHGAITILATLDPTLTTEFTFFNTAVLTGTLGLAHFSANSSAGLEVNISPSVNAGEDQTVPVNKTFTLTASFFDPGLDDLHTASINWGDGNITTGVVNQTTDTVTASHKYAALKTYTITITVTDNDGGQSSDEVKFTVELNQLFLPVILRP